ncbi:MAG: DUF4276 family protein [Nannocystaceae bacterium]
MIAEDKTDCSALTIIIKRLLGDGVKVRVKSGRGCARMRKKVRPWANDLARQGCQVLIMVHDLDRDPNSGHLNDEEALRTRLKEVFETPKDVDKYICIPKEELEAWFWSDLNVLRKVSRNPAYTRECHEPEGKKKPKEALMRLSRDSNGKARYSTNDNPELARILDLEQCALKCRAFQMVKNFVESAVN